MFKKLVLAAMAVSLLVAAPARGLILCDDVTLGDGVLFGPNVLVLDPSLSLYSRRIRGAAAVVSETKPADTAFTEAIITRAIEDARAA